MENFRIDNPTILHFGKDVIGGSIKKNGIYESVMVQLHGIGAEVIEYSGIKPNPIVEDVNAAAEKGKQFQPDVILAVGGGSVWQNQLQPFP
jgi:alcohol dehydrogenase YqhD (iron-dependent ADH family)